MITAKFDIDDLFRNITQNRLPLFIQAITEALERTCMQVVTEAKQLNTYKDRTNNLRSSIGYVIYNNGEHVADNFEAAGVGQEGDGSEGMMKGQQVAEETAAMFPSGIVAVVVAGEDYALFVEARGYDVITGPSRSLNEKLQANLNIIKEAAGQ